MRIPQAPAAPGAERVQANINIKAEALDPDTLSVASGKRLVLTISNGDRVPHSFTIPGLGLRLAALAPGASRTVELNASRPGSYPYYSDTAGGSRKSGTLTITTPV